MSNRSRAQAEYDKRMREVNQAGKDMRAARAKAKQLADRKDPGAARAKDEAERLLRAHAQAHQELGKANDMLRKSM